MDILRNLFGSLTSGIIRLLVTVGILFAAYLLIIKPVLHSVDNATNSLKNNGVNDVSKTIEGVNKKLGEQFRHSFEATKRAGRNPQKLVRCVERAHGNVLELKRCTNKF
jgi:hypothetical protein